MLLLKRAPGAPPSKDQPPGAGRASYSLHDEDGHVHVWDVDVGDVATRGDHEAAGQNGERHGRRCDGDERRARAEHLVGVLGNSRARARVRVRVRVRVRARVRARG